MQYSAPSYKVTAVDDFRRETRAINFEFNSNTIHYIKLVYIFRKFYMPPEETLQPSILSCKLIIIPIGFISYRTVEDTFLIITSNNSIWLFKPCSKFHSSRIRVLFSTPARKIPHYFPNARGWYSISPSLRGCWENIVHNVGGNGEMRLLYCIIQLQLVLRTHNRLIHFFFSSCEMRSPHVLKDYAFFSNNKQY